MIGSQDASVIVLSEIVIFGTVVYSQDWFLLKILLLSQLMTFLILIAYYQTEQVKKHTLRSRRGLALYIFPLFVFALTGIFFTKPFQPEGNWEAAANLFSGTFGELTLVVGLLLSVFVVLGSLALEGKRRW